MNRNRKSELQDRRIATLTKQIERLRTQNQILKEKNTTLSDSVEIYKYQLSSLERTKTEYEQGIEEIKDIQRQYQEAIMDAKITKREYKIKFKQLMNDYKKHA